MGNHLHAEQTVHLRGSWNGEELEKASTQGISILEIDNFLVRVPAWKTKDDVRRFCLQSYDGLNFFEHDGCFDFCTIAHLQGKGGRIALLDYDLNTNLGL